IVETIPADAVVQALKSRGISYAPIAVVGTYIPEANSKLIQQENFISMALGPLGVPVSMTYDPNRLVDAKTEDRVGAIYKPLVESVELSRRAIETTGLRILCAQSPTHAACDQLRQARGAGWQGRFATNLSERQLSDEQIRNIYGRGMSQ